MRHFAYIFLVVISFSAFGQEHKFLSKEDKQQVLIKMVDYESSVFYADSMFNEYQKQPFSTDKKENVSSDGKIFLIQLYNKADSFKSCDYCKEKIAGLYGTLNAESIAEEERQYQKVLDKAKEHRQKNDLVKAKELYTRAISFKPNDPEPKQAIEEIDKLLYERTKEK